ncbi:hypothetical protein NQZ68_018185 [Dissostichus eleginoides]|nr:hypothetical protein NQZ68_018185 [Dissostichus eleginoides]
MLATSQGAILQSESTKVKQNCSSSPEHGLQKVTNMADAAGSETGTETRSIKEEKDADPTTGTETRSIKEEKNADPTTGTETRSIKKEKDADPTAGHLHRFSVKFSPSDPKEYTIDCVQPGTVLQAIKTCHKYDEQFSDENLVIQLEGGKNTLTKPFIRSNAFKRFKYLCVYGEKGRKMTVEDALRRDGRFIDDLGNFTLSDNKDPMKITGCKQPVNNLDGDKFKLCLERKRNKKAVPEEVKQRINVIQKTMENKSSVQDLVDRVREMNKSQVKSGKSGSGVEVEEIYDLLREQCPDLKQLMMRRIPDDDSYEEELDLREEDFGKIRQSFSDVHRVRELIKLSESVCKVVVEGYCTGTGFVLFGNFILTNLHLFKHCVEKGNKKLKDDTEVYVLFNFEEEDKNLHRFKLAHRNICYCHELDYAILELESVSQKDNPETTEDTKEKVPPGLLKRFGPMPESGEACLIGHPDGGVKKLDPTSIIEKENREKAVDTAFILHNINVPPKRSIKRIFVGGSRAENVATYNTFMYHGSSGSPVFDAKCKVFGLHTSGFVYDPDKSKSVIEWAQRLLSIFEHFVRKLKENRDEELLKRVEEEAKGNSDLKEILKKILKRD